METDTKELLARANKFCMACEEESGAAKAFGIKRAMRKVLKMDLTTFLLYLANADGIATQAEVDYINDLLEWDYDLDFFEKYICDTDLFDVDYAQSVPITLCVFALYDKVEQPEQSAAGALIDLYRAAAAGLSMSDGILVHTESTQTASVLNAMQEYVMNNK